MYSLQIESKNGNNHFLQLTQTIKTSDDVLYVVLPAWRPGRYERGNFAKYIRGLRFTNKKGKLLSAQKVSLNRWKVLNPKQADVYLHYEFYAKDLNAGFTYIDNKHGLFNPVNFTFYVAGQENNPIKVSLKGMGNLKVACGVKFSSKGVATFSTMHDWFDSPVLLSEELVTISFKASNGMKVYMHHHGNFVYDTKQIKKDFKAYTDLMIADFGSFPQKDFHYLFITTPHRMHHGVEHQNSTVIVLGPEKDIATPKGYNEFLGISSHEFYHCWNIKSIRPKEWQPYNYEVECPSELGYIAEGVTTYAGDVYLLRSGVWDLEQFFSELADAIHKHIDNPGRFNYAVAESSFDTWLDGYEAGIPGRKTSIYNEGSLLALIADVHILLASKGTYGLKDVMKYLYINFGLKQKGIRHKDYFKAISKYANVEVAKLIEALVFARVDYMPHLSYVINLMGLQIDQKPVANVLQANLGLLYNSDYIVVNTKAESPAELAGLLIGDELISIEGLSIESFIYPENCSELNIQIKRKSELHKLKVYPDGEVYNHSVEIIAAPDIMNEDAERLLHTFIN